jgi:hypothetical protein
MKLRGGRRWGAVTLPSVAAMFAASVIPAMLSRLSKWPGWAALDTRWTL